MRTNLLSTTEGISKDQMRQCLQKTLSTLKCWPPLKNQALLLVDFRNCIPSSLTNSKQKLGLCNQPTCWATPACEGHMCAYGKNQESAQGLACTEMSHHVRRKSEDIEDKVRRCGIRKRQEAGGLKQKRRPGFWQGSAT